MSSFLWLVGYLFVRDLYLAITVVGVHCLNGKDWLLLDPCCAGSAFLLRCASLEFVKLLLASEAMFAYSF